MARRDRRVSEDIMRDPLPMGSTLKSVAELLLRCAPQTPLSVDPGGVSFVASDASSGRLIHVRLGAEDLLQFHIHHGGSSPFRCTLETGSIHAVFRPMGRRRHPLTSIS